jgi:hypothetical protein
LELQTEQVLYWDLADVDPDRPLLEQLSALKEDLLQVIASEAFIIDVGWYPEFSPDGSFGVVLIRDENWANPVAQRTCGSILELKRCLRETLRVASNFRQA